MTAVAQALAEFQRSHRALLVAAQVLRDALEAAAGASTHYTPADVRVIQMTVAEHYRLALPALASRDRRVVVARPRLIAITLCAELTIHTTTVIAAAFNRDHGMVHHARAAVAAWCDTERATAAEFQTLRATAVAALKETTRHVA
jgi:chromosomal replication initiation ATPase DnaA